MKHILMEFEVFIERNTLEIVTWEMSARLSLPQCVKRSILYLEVSHRNGIHLVPVECHLKQCLNLHIVIIESVWR